jgi:hypothetical protein
MDYAARADDAGTIETRAHEILRTNRAHGDWFNVDSETAISAVIQAAAELGFALTRVEDNFLPIERPTDTEPVTLRLQLEVLDAVEDARRSMPVIPSRQEVLRTAIVEWLRAKGFLK